MGIITIVGEVDEIVGKNGFASVRFKKIIKTSPGNALLREELLTTKCQLLKQPYDSSAEYRIEQINEELIKDIQQNI